MSTQKKAKLTFEAEDFKKHIQKNLKSEVDPAWKVLTSSPQIYVWRIENFIPTLIDKPHHGSFYDGDSYIVLNAYMGKNNKLCYDVFIWIGKHSTADEYGTAAYKMAELDMEILKDAAVQHREVQGNESAKFQELFPQISILKGGITSGFKKVTNEKPEPKLLHVSGIKKNVKIQEISYKKDNLTADDVFIIDLWDDVYQVNGKSCSKDEKFKGAGVLNEIKSKRGKVKTEVIDDFVPGTSHPAIDNMPLANKQKQKKVVKTKRPLSLWQLSDSSGKMEMKEISTGKCSKSSLDTKDVFILDANDKLFVWIGKQTTRQEKLAALSYAQKYANKVGEPKISFVSMSEGFENEEFNALLS